MNSADVTDLLTGPGAGLMLQSALTGQQETPVPGFRYQIDAVHARPGAETSGGYQVWYQAGDQEVNDVLVATTAEIEGQVQISLEGQTINIWRHPADPALPGLAAASDPEQLASWTGQQPDRVRQRVYRPLRRAVIEFSSSNGGGRDTIWFAKIVRPKVLSGLAHRLQLADEAGIGPRLAHVDPSGVLINERAPGMPLADLLSAAQTGAGGPAPDALDMIDALDRLPPGLMELPAYPSWTDRTSFHADLAKRVLTDQADEITRIAQRIIELNQQLPKGPLVPTHGDVYEANVFWDGHNPTFIDLDHAGPGYRVDDLACVLAHLAVLPQLSPTHYPHGTEVLTTWHAEFAKRCHPGALAVRVAGVLLSLIGAAQREPALHRLELVRSWLYRAEMGSQD